MLRGARSAEFARAPVHRLSRPSGAHASCAARRCRAEPGSADGPGHRRTGRRGGARRAIALGAYVGSDSVSDLRAVEHSLGARLAIASSFRGWGDLFPDGAQQAQAAAGHTPAGRVGSGRDRRRPGSRRSTTTATTPTSAVRRRPPGSSARPFYVRPWAEMNADWVAFQPTRVRRPAGRRHLSPSSSRAWRYLVDFFRDHGASNVRWVFDPTTDTYAETTPVAPHLARRAAMSTCSVSTGTTGAPAAMLRWRSFADIYRTQYARLTALAPAAAGLGLRVRQQGRQRERRRARRPAPFDGGLVLAGCSRGCAARTPSARW